MKRWLVMLAAVLAMVGTTAGLASADSALWYAAPGQNQFTSTMTDSTSFGNFSYNIVNTFEANTNLTTGYWETTQVSGNYNDTGTAMDYGPEWLCPSNGATCTRYLNPLCLSFMTTVGPWSNNDLSTPLSPTQTTYSMEYVYWDQNSGCPDATFAEYDMVEILPDGPGKPISRPHSSPVQPLTLQQAAAQVPFSVQAPAQLPSGVSLRDVTVNNGVPGNPFVQLDYTSDGHMVFDVVESRAGGVAAGGTQSPTTAGGGPATITTVQTGAGPITTLSWTRGGVTYLLDDWNNALSVQELHTIAASL